MKPFFTKKQKKLMRERRLKGKRASRTAAVGPSGRVDDHAHRRNKNEAVEEKPSTPPTSQVPTPGSKRPRSSPAADGIASKPPNEASTSTAAAAAASHAKGDHQAVNAAVVVVVVPSNLSGKEAKKFRKDARRKHRAEGREVTFVDGNKERDGAGERADEEDDRSGKRKKRNHPPSAVAKRAADVPRINDLVQEAKELAERQKKQQSASEEEGQLPEAHKRRFVALDCEMVGIGTDGKTSVLARVSVVDWDYQVLLDTYVQVESKVVDFRTKFSGIKPKHIKDAMKPDVVRQRVADLVRDKVLVGHALQNDLHALLLKHPKANIRDTSKYRPFQRHHGNKWRPRKLRDLVKEHLGKTIQEGSHDSVTDAASTMELFRLVRAEWERELAEKTRKKPKDGARSTLTSAVS